VSNVFDRRLESITSGFNEHNLVVRGATKLADRLNWRSERSEQGQERTEAAHARKKHESHAQQAETNANNGEHSHHLLSPLPTLSPDLLSKLCYIPAACHDGE
jgi:hypothetical protein